jgi:hypothetical protein
MESINAIVVLFLTLMSEPRETCNATRFGRPGDKWAGGDALYLKRPVGADDVGVAHRTLPLGAFVVVQNLETSKIAVGQVIDRGPYGAIHEGEWTLKRKKSEPGNWRGCLDMTPRLTEILGHDGYGKVRVWTVD